MNTVIRRALAGLVTTTALTAGLLGAITPAHAATGTDVATLARNNENKGPCQTNSIGGTGFQGPNESSCSGNAWCADFAGWAWANAGDHSIDVTGLTQGSWTFYNYGRRHTGSLHTDTGYRPQIGDAAVYNVTSYAANGDATYSDHVGLVTLVNPNGSIEVTNGNFSDKVMTNAIPASQVPVGSYQSAQGNTISAYVTPSGLSTPPPPPVPESFGGKLVDLNGDGKPDVIGRLNDNLYVWLNTTTTQTTVSGAVNLGAGWATMNSLMVADFNGDGKPDVLARQNDHLYVWLNTSTAGQPSVAGATDLGTGWTSENSLMAADFNGDGKADIIARLADNLYAWTSNGTGLSTPTNLGNGWTTMNALMTGDFNNDGKLDVLARQNDNLYVWKSTGTSLGGANNLGNGWTTITFVTKA
ncbi:hypothetical protein Lfu02_47600 [Longispora fulva]|uniref:FG-GAP-like repeat-containing protein n=1 Tax=Longispora fulva TaxID=619741 RepID=UPI0019436617|nr:FG-GAP-like repeat-containing protein [Longispora fulva]GIG60388.1 hypothetical protein Lfu02_47600 [Longispora fulva]